jgi:DNA-binding response OmpR family regulator
VFLAHARPGLRRRDRPEQDRTDFVRKPFSPGDITSRVRGLIRRVAVLRMTEAER